MWPEHRETPSIARNSGFGQVVLLSSMSELMCHGDHPNKLLWRAQPLLPCESNDSHSLAMSSLHHPWISLMCIPLKGEGGGKREREILSMVKGENVIVAMQQGSKREKETMDVNHIWLTLGLHRQTALYFNKRLYFYCNSRHLTL